MNHRVLC